MASKLLNSIKSMYVNSLVCVRIKGGESECLKINSGVRPGRIMSPWLFNVYIGENGDGEEGKSGDCLASCMQMTWYCVVN